MLHHKRKTPQERIFLALEKADAYRRNHPVTQQVMLTIRYADAEISSRSETDQIAVARHWESVNAKNEKLLATLDKRISKIYKIQQEHEISAIVWETVSFNEASLQFPTVHHLLKPTNDDVRLLTEYKSKIIQFTIEVGSKNNFKFFRINPMVEEWIPMENPSEIWSVSSFYEQAYLHILDTSEERSGTVMDLMLSTGFGDSYNGAVFFCATSPE